MKMSIRDLCHIAVLLGVIIAPVIADAETKKRGLVPSSADQIQPLAVGEKVGDVTLRTLEGKDVQLHALLSKKPSVLVFYRGGWCMYCNRHLAHLKDAEARLIDMGYQIIAITPDRPEKIAETVGKHELRYTILSDSKMDAAQSLGVAFKVDDATLEKYEGYGIDLVTASGETHQYLPVPSVFIVDRKGIVRFQHASPDYTVRLDKETLLAAARKEGGVNVLKHSVKDIDGKQTELAQYGGKVLMIVNVASKCGLTPQYAQLQNLYEEYENKGFRILAFPANNFRNQEPGTNEEIKRFCSTKYDVTFNLSAKISVCDDDMAPLYMDLTSKETNGVFGGEIKWNFTKFLVGRDGSVIDRFEPKTEPNAPHVRKAIEKALAVRVKEESGTKSKDSITSSP
jgi:glutathione peroxidase